MYKSAYGTVTVTIEKTTGHTKFTISNVKDSKIVPMYTNIKPDRQLTKDDVFNFYKLSSVGKPSNQEIEIFQLFKDRPVETGTVGWVGVGWRRIHRLQALGRMARRRPKSSRLATMPTILE